MSFDLFGNPVEKVVQDNSAEIKKRLLEAKDDWIRMSNLAESARMLWEEAKNQAQMAKEEYLRVKKEAGL